LKKEREQAQILMIQGVAIKSISTIRVIEEMYADLKYDIIRKLDDDIFIK
jgi:hypothetical protein